MTLPVPIAPISAAEMAACNCVLETNAVVLGLPFHWTVEVGKKFVPATVSVKDPPPTTAELGFKLLILGGGGVTVKVTPLLAAPPTVTTTLPVVAPAGTGTAKLVAVQFVGVPAAPLNVTVLLPCVAPKFVPVIVTVVPTKPKVGLRFVIVGELLPLPAAALNAANPTPHFTEALSDALATAVPVTA